MLENNEKTYKTLSRKEFLKIAGVLGGTCAVASIAAVALGAGGGAAGAGGGGGGSGTYANGWCSFWHDEQDPTYGSTALNGQSPQGWDTESARNQLNRLNKMVSLDYTGDPNAGYVAIDSPSTPSNDLESIYYTVAEDALRKARERASEQRGVTVEHARVIGVGIRYMITTWRPGTYGRDGSATATFGDFALGPWDQPLFYKNEMNPSNMIASSQGVARGLQEQAGWGDESSIYGYTAPTYATNRDGEWQRAWDDLPGRFTLIVVAIAESEPLSRGYVNTEKHPSM